MKLDYSSESKQEFSAANMVVMTDQEIGFGSMRESNFVSHECGGSFGNGEWGFLSFLMSLRIYFCLMFLRRGWCLLHYIWSGSLLFVFSVNCHRG